MSTDELLSKMIASVDINEPRTSNYKQSYISAQRTFFVSEDGEYDYKLVGEIFDQYQMLNGIKEKNGKDLKEYTDEDGNEVDGYKGKKLELAFGFFDKFVLSEIIDKAKKINPKFKIQKDQATLIADYNKSGNRQEFYNNNKGKINIDNVLTSITNTTDNLKDAYNAYKAALNNKRLSAEMINKNNFDKRDIAAKVIQSQWLKILNQKNGAAIIELEKFKRDYNYKDLSEEITGKRGEIKKRNEEMSSLDKQITDNSTKGSDETPSKNHKKKKISSDDVKKSIQNKKKLEALKADKRELESKIKILQKEYNKLHSEKHKNELEFQQNKASYFKLEPKYKKAEDIVAKSHHKFEMYEYEGILKEFNQLMHPKIPVDLTPPQYNENDLLAQRLIKAMQEMKDEDELLFEGFNIVFVGKGKKLDNPIDDTIVISIDADGIKIDGSSIAKKSMLQFQKAIKNIFSNLKIDKKSKEKEFIVKLDQDNINKEIFDLDAETAKVIQEIFDLEYAWQLEQQEYQLDIEYLKKFTTNFDINSIEFLLSKYFGGFVGKYTVEKGYKYNKNTIPDGDIEFNPDGDGNCFYSAFLGNQEQATPYNINVLRNDVADHIQNHQVIYFEHIMIEAVSYYHQYHRLPAFFNIGTTTDERTTFFDHVRTYETNGNLNHINNEARGRIVTQYTNNVRRDGVWAGHIEIGVVSEIRNANIAVHQVSGVVVPNNPEQINNETQVIDLYFTGNHYMRGSSNPNSVFEKRKAEIKLQKEEKIDHEMALRRMENDERKGIEGVNIKEIKVQNPEEIKEGENQDKSKIEEYVNTKKEVKEIKSNNKRDEQNEEYDNINNSQDENNDNEDKNNNINGLTTKEQKGHSIKSINFNLSSIINGVNVRGCNILCVSY